MLFRSSTTFDVREVRHKGLLEKWDSLRPRTRKGLDDNVYHIQCKKPVSSIDGVHTQNQVGTFPTPTWHLSKTTTVTRARYAILSLEMGCSSERFYFTYTKLFAVRYKLMTFVNAIQVSVLRLGWWRALEQHEGLPRLGGGVKGKSPIVSTETTSRSCFQHVDLVVCCVDVVVFQCGKLGDILLCPQVSNRPPAYLMPKTVVVC